MQAIVLGGSLRPVSASVSSSSAASEVYKRQPPACGRPSTAWPAGSATPAWCRTTSPVSYTHLRAHETPEHLVCRLLLDITIKPDSLPPPAPPDSRSAPMQATASAVHTPRPPR